MADRDIGSTSDGLAVFATDAKTDAAMAKPSSYCGECGSWGAHAAKCVSCGYDFYADPIDTLASD